MNLIQTLIVVSFIWTVGILMAGFCILTIPFAFATDALGEVIVLVVILIITITVMALIPHTLLRSYRNDELYRKRKQHPLWLGNVMVRSHNVEKDQYEIKIQRTNDTDESYPWFSKEEAEQVKLDIVENQRVLNRLYRVMENHTLKVNEDVGG